MDTLSIVALLMILMLVVMIGALFWFLGGLPGRVAKERNHPYQQAITVGGWTTLILAGVAWPIVLIWAYAPSLTGDSAALSVVNENKLRKENESLQAEVDRLTAQVDRLTVQERKEL